MESGPISNDSYARIAHQVLLVQPLEGIFSKTEKAENLGMGKTTHLIDVFCRGSVIYKPCT